MSRTVLHSLRALRSSFGPFPSAAEGRTAMQRTVAGSKRQTDGKRAVHWRLLHVPSRPQHGWCGSMPRQPLPFAALGQPGGDGGRRQWQRGGGGGQKRGIHFLPLWSMFGKFLVRYGSWIAGRVLRRAVKKEKITKHLPTVAGFALVGSATYIACYVEEVPFSGRRRIQSLPPDALHKFGDMASSQLVEELQGRILRTNDRVHVRVNSVFQRLLSTVRRMPELSDCAERLDWKLFVVENKEFNCFALPNGHVFVNTGFLDVLDGYDNRDDTLASVIGHEMSHALLRHAAEKMSIQPIADVAGFFAQSALWFYLPEGSEIALEFFNKTAEQAMGAFLELPFSRTCELEADQVGLLIAAKACYDPSKVPKFWEFCEGKGLGQSELDAFLSTHPGSLSRMELLEETLPSAQHSYRANPACDQYREMEAAAKKARQWTRYTDGATGLVFYVDKVSGAREWSIPKDVVAVRDAMRRRLDQEQKVDGRDKRGPGDEEARHGVRRGLSFPSAFAASMTFGGGGGARGDTQVPPSLGSLLDSLRSLERGEVGEREEREAVRECKALAKQLMRR